MSKVSLPLSLKVPAKVNLGLYVGQRRGDGLHEIASLFQSVSLFDQIEVEYADGHEDQVYCEGVAGENLAVTALSGFRKALSSELPPLNIKIDKGIPVAAGLGGGSGDGAAVLWLANELCGRPFDIEGLRKLAFGVGADLPFQLEPGLAVVGGAGEKVTPLDPFSEDLWLVLVPGKTGLSTAQVYGEFEDTVEARDAEELAVKLQQLAEVERFAELAALENDLQPSAVALQPQIATAFSELHACAAGAVRVTGSGPTVFGLFDDQAAALLAAKKLSDCAATVVTPVSGQVID